YTVDLGDGPRLVDNDEEWWMAILSNQMMEMMATRLLVGDSTSMYSSTTIPNDSDGLMKLLTMSYDCV
ncbi:MAG: hypothetical protein KDE50_23285, partial [Caldilineaceae bacterium]|nr:hypothetical protein [Caldilineaceae bacterium]